MRGGVAGTAPPDLASLAHGSFGSSGGSDGGWHCDASAHAAQPVGLVQPIAPSPVGMEGWHGLVVEEPGQAPVVDATLLQSIFDEEGEDEDWEGRSRAVDPAGVTRHATCQPSHGPGIAPQARGEFPRS